MSRNTIIELILLSIILLGSFNYPLPLLAGTAGILVVSVVNKKINLNFPLVLIYTFIFCCFYFRLNWNYFPSYPVVFLISLYTRSLTFKNPYLPLFSLTIPLGMLLSSIFYHTPIVLTSIFKPFLTITLGEIFLITSLTLLDKSTDKLLELTNSSLNYEELLELSYFDSLTGLYNRRSLEQEAKIRNRAFEEKNVSYAVLMADIDFFKQYNDALGHLAGDEALKSIAGTIKNAVRTQDKVFRYGGEEFLIVLPETSPEKARQIAERIRHAVCRDLELPLTLSIGIGHCPQNAASFWEVVKAADTALYQAKNKGRNSVYALNA